MFKQFRSKLIGSNNGLTTGSAGSTGSGAAARTSPTKSKDKREATPSSMLEMDVDVVQYENSSAEDDDSDVEQVKEDLEFSPYRKAGKHQKGIITSPKNNNTISSPSGTFSSPSKKGMKSKIATVVGGTRGISSVASSDSEDDEEEEVEDLLDDGNDDDPSQDNKNDAPPLAHLNLPFDILRDVPFFAQFIPEDQQALYKELCEQVYNDGDTIVKQGELGDRFYVITEGEAVVTKEKQNGELHDITHIYPGDFFGELVLIYGGSRVATVTSIGTTKVMYLTKAAFEKHEGIRYFLILQKVPLLANLRKEQQMMIVSKLKAKTFEPGEFVVRQGEKGDAFFLITRGSAVVIEDEDKIITRLYEGHSFGEMSLLSDEPRVASVKAETALNCMYLEAEHFKELLSADDFARLLETENKKIRELRDRRQWQRANSSAGLASQSSKAVTAHQRRIRAASQSKPAGTQNKLTTGTRRDGAVVVNGYVLEHQIGKGTFGKVYLCHHEISSEKFAIKIIDKKAFDKKFKSKHAGNYEDMKAEVSIMKRLSHPNVVNLVDVVDDPRADQLYLIQEYCAKGAIMEGLDDNEPLSESTARRYFRDLLMGVDYLHAHKIIHRDIKPMNLLVTEDDIVKIGDFGAARVLKGEKAVGIAGTPAFMAPELLSEDTSLYNGAAVDLWSCGATLFMLVTGVPPWMSDDEITLANRVKKDELIFPGDWAQKLSPHVRNLITRLLVKDPAGRLDLQGAMEHEWVTEEGSEPIPRFKELQPQLIRASSDVRMGNNDSQDVIISQLKHSSAFEDSNFNFDGTNMDLGDDIQVVNESEIFSDDTNSLGPGDLMETSTSDDTYGRPNADSVSSNDYFTKLDVGRKRPQSKKMSVVDAFRRRIPSKDAAEAKSTGAIAGRPSFGAQLFGRRKASSNSSSNSPDRAVDRSIQAMTPLPSSIKFVGARRGISVSHCGVLYGIAENQGLRQTMEDMTQVVGKLKSPDTLYAAVFDGHGGDLVSKQLKNTFHKYLVKNKYFDSNNLQLALRRTCLAVDRKMLHYAATELLTEQEQVAKSNGQKRLIRTTGGTKGKESILDVYRKAGSTAVIALVRVNKITKQRVLTIGWVGDSRAVMCRSGQPMALTMDHRANRADETARIRVAGGSVRNGRLYGDLQVSRAFGDLQHKGRDLHYVISKGAEATSEEDEEFGVEGTLIACPDTVEIALAHQDEFLILATDGVWDHLSNTDAVNFVRYGLHTHGDVRKVAVELTQKAVEMGSLDNSTCVILSFMQA